MQKTIRRPKQKNLISSFWRNNKVLIGIVAVVCFVFLFSIRQYVEQPISGDEPHYLLMDYSLVKDGDVDLKNNYQNNDYFRYYPAPTPNHVSPLNLEDPSSGWYSFHGIGLPLITLPGFVWNERLGPVITMTIVATIVVLLTWAWALQVTKNKKASLIAAGLLMICYFFNGLAGYLYPDLLTAGLTLSALIILKGHYKDPRMHLVFGVILGLMVVIHAKSLSVAIPLGLVMTYKVWKYQKRLPWLVLLAGLPFAVFFFWTLHRWFGTWNPAAIYPTYLGFVSPLESIPASLFDAKRGLLVYNPALLLIFCGLPLWFKKSKSSLYLTLLVTVPALIITMIFSEWYGGYAPMGRYLMNFLPAFLPAFAYFLVSVKSNLQKWLVVSLAGATLFATLFASSIHLRYPSDEPRSMFFVELQNKLGVPFDKILPKYSLNTELTDRFGLAKVLFGVLLVLGALYYGYLLAIKEPGASPKKFRRAN